MGAAGDPPGGERGCRGAGADGDGGGGGGSGGGQRAAEGADSLAAALWRSGLWRVLCVLLVYSMGFSTLLPVTPTIFTNFFASRAAGGPTDCQATPKLPACINAHAEVVRWSSSTSFVSNSLVATVFSPLVGDASDAAGRKPFLAAALLLAMLPSAAVVAHLSLPSPGDALLLYYPASVVSSVISSVVVCLSYTSDKLPPRHRTGGYGLIIAAFSLGFAVGPLLGAALAPAAAAWVTLCATAACAGAVVVAVPESLPPAAAAQCRADRAARRARGGGARSRPLDALMSLGRSWALVNSRPFFRRLALVMALLGFVQGGVQEMLVQYLQLTLGFTTADQGALFVVLGVANIVVQVAVLPVLVPMLGERRLLLLGLAVSALEQALLAAAAAKWQVLAAIAVGALGGVGFPALSALKANACRADEQGLVQGALAGIRSLSSGLGPLAFSALFAACTTTGGALSGRAALVFWAAAAMTLVALGVAATVRVPDAPCGGGGGDERVVVVAVPRAAAPAGAADAERGGGGGDDDGDDTAARDDDDGATGAAAAAAGALASVKVERQADEPRRQARRQRRGARGGGAQDGGAREPLLPGDADA